MADPQFDPPRSLPTYAVRKPLLRFLREQADEAHATFGRFRVLDVGCGRKFYEPLFAAHATSYVGVDPDWQGRGLGAALMRPILDRCDADGVAAYLEASSPRNRVLYERHGFVVTKELSVADSPSLYGMWRAPRA